MPRLVSARAAITPLIAAAVTLGAAAAAVGQVEARYEACLTAIRADAEAAYETALAWRHQGGGWPAEHCVSLALIALGHDGPGAARLSAAAEAAASASPMSRAIMFGQAGDGFLAADRAEEAELAFARGLTFAPLDYGLRLGLAQARLANGDDAGAQSAAGAALEIEPDGVEALRVRAEARLAMGDLDGAEADLTAARVQAPEDIDLLLLRGRINEARRNR